MSSRVDAPNRRNIVTNQSSVEASYEDLLNKHVAYVIKLGATMDNVDHQGWIDAVGDTHFAALTEAQNAVDLIDMDAVNVNPDRTIPIVKEELELLELKLNALHAALQAAVVEEMNKEQHEDLCKRQAVLERLLLEHREISRELRALDAANADDLNTAHRAYQAQKIPILENLSIALAAKRPGAPVAPAATGGAGVPAAGAAPDAPRGPPGDNRKSAKLKPVSCPKFSGKAQDYSSFRLKFDEMITPFYDPSSQLEYLESALPQAVKDKMSLVRKTPLQIFEQLEQWYNDPKLVLKESVSELYNLSKLKLKPEDLMVRFHNTLLDTETLLDEVGQGDYLRHPREVSALEDLLPTEEAKEFIRRDSRLTGNEYEKLRQFLIERMTEIQKLSRLGTKANNDVSADTKDDFRKSKACFKCGEDGHFSRDCTKAGGDKDTRAGNGKGRGKNSKADGNAVGHEAHTNSFRPSSCRRCKHAKTGQAAKPCPGCTKVGKDLNHCLGHCPKYSMESVTGKTDMVKRSGACVVCLGVGHGADDCNFKDKDNSVCGLDGCTSHHHPSLHGSKDKFVTSVSATSIKLPKIKSTTQETFSNWKKAQEVLHKIEGSKEEKQMEQKRREKEYLEIQRLLEVPMLNGDRILLSLQSIAIKFGIDSKQTDVAAFFDNGSTCSLILEELAETLGLLGQDILVTISTVNGEKERQTKLYVVELLTNKGERKIIRALGVENISGEIPEIKLDGVKQFFSQNLSDQWEAVTKRPKGQIQLLIGSERAGIHPRGVETVEDLIISESMFGNGWAIHGHHNKVVGDYVTFNEDVSAIRTGGYKVLECGKINYKPSLTYTYVWNQVGKRLNQEEVQSSKTISESSPSMGKRGEEGLACPPYPVEDYPQAWPCGLGVRRGAENEDGDNNPVKEENTPKISTETDINKDKKTVGFHEKLMVMENDGSIHLETMPQTSSFADVTDLEESHMKSEDENTPEVEANTKNNFHSGLRQEIDATIPKDFNLIEDLGVEPPRRCNQCRKCKDCSFRGMVQSEKEADEYRLMEEGVSYCQNTGKFHVTYPFLGDPSLLRDNIGQVIKIGQREEILLEKEGKTELANQVFGKLIEVGAVRLLSQIEQDTWTGPKHYVSIQHVLADSPTTPLRLVTNSSLKDPKTGFSLNDLLCKGPNCLAQTYEILLRFRTHKKGLIADITKAYYAMLTGLLEMHVRRVVWRWGDRSSVWQVYAFIVVSMGDRPAATLLEIVIRKTLQMFGSIDRMAATKLESDRYVDDLISGGELEEVERFVGNQDPETYSCNGTMAEIMGKGNLRFKAMAYSGEPDGEKLHKLGGSVLGHGFSTESDTLVIEFSVNISKKRRGVPQGPDLTPDTLSELNNYEFSKRKCLSISNSIYDLLGIVSPITIAVKIAQKELFSPEHKLGWDTPLTEELAGRWREIAKVLVITKKITFPRRFQPREAKCEDYIIVSFWDGSDEAFSCVLYGRWMVGDGEYKAGLIASKARVSPNWSKNTPRSELNGAVLLTRLLVRVIRAFDIKPSKVVIAGDSETILAAREKEGKYFNEYFSNRVGETWDNQRKIEELSPVGTGGEWFHVPSLQNPADKCTRSDISMAEVGEGSVWQEGPDYLSLPEDQWPLERNFATRKGKVSIPMDEVAKKYKDQFPVNQISITFEKLEDVDKKLKCYKVKAAPDSLVQHEYILKHFQEGFCTNSWSELLRRTGYLFRWFLRLVRVKQKVIIPEKEMATAFWINIAMPATRKALTEGKLKQLTTWEKDGIVVVTGRAEQGLKNYYGSSYLPVIMSSTRTAFLIMLHAHCQDHSNRDVTLATATQEAWIVGGRLLAAKIKHMCVRCRFLDRKLEGQKMSVLPEQLTVPCPPWTNLGLDLAGPFEIKIVGGSKTTRGNKGTFKAWVVVIVCLNTKAVKLYVSCGYATRDFLLSWEQHVSDCGNPKFVHSDRGSQLVSAAKEIEDKPDYDWDLISSSTGVTWRFTPSQGQWRNGSSEIYVKKLKRSLKHTYGDKGLNLQEFITALKRVSNILNSRPIYAMMGPTGGADPDYIQRLTPNMLLLARSGQDLPMREYEDTSDPLTRLSYVMELEKLWWNQHKTQDFASLIPTRKWTEAKRNMSPADIVLIQYNSVSKSGTYRLGRVILVEVDTDGLVRTCIVKYSLLQNLSGKEKLKYKGISWKMIRVPIQRLVLLVPVEEQSPVVAISPKELEEAKEISRKATKTQDEENTAGLSKTALSNHSIESLLKARGEFDFSWGKIVSYSFQTIPAHLDDDVFEVRDLIERPYLLNLNQSFLPLESVRYPAADEVAAAT